MSEVLVVELIGAIAFAVMAAVTPFVIMEDRRVRRRQIELWRAVAEEHGVHGLDATIPWSGRSRLEGRARNRPVRFERYPQINSWDPENKHLVLTCVLVHGNSGMTLRLEDRSSRSKDREREIELGDEAFDRDVEVHGPPDRVRALLDATTRVTVRRMLRGLLEVPGGKLVPIGAAVRLVDGELMVLFGEQGTTPTHQELSQALGALLQLSDRFERPRNVAERLAQALEREPHWRVRLRGLELLATSYPRNPATKQAARHALGDELPEIRLEAAIALGEEGVPVLLEIAALAEAEDATTARAIDALGDRFPAEASEAALRQALRLRRLQTADACIEALGRSGGAEAARLLAKVLSVESGPLAVAAARALGTAGAATPEVEPILLDALARDLADLTVPVVEALGRTGSVRAVLPIQEAAARYGSDADVGRAARQAVAEIQSRLPGASPGQISLAEGEAGQLSLADDDPRGRVSLPEAR